MEDDPRTSLCREVATSNGPMKPSHDLDHVRRVVALARHIARVEGADEVLVACAAYLHDMERGREDAGGEDHAVAGARMARDVLGGSDLFGDREVELVAGAIASHRYRSGPPPSTLEAQCLHDADKLDALGAVGVGRAYMMAGEHGQRLHNRVGGNETARHVGDIDHSRYSPVEEYTVKLRHLPDRMTTEEGRRIARRRAEFMASFFEELEAEVGGSR
ncbi:MAG: HD domain-containing protein [Thermoplasmata archaeon]|nr:HD domain-containing protein [Thermoplasmata archaeon]NIT77057.1 HD domain-containing protein [Thermoplasmata archaeon]NIU48974.1 HD domain-containing protein [Thermoplasmata archaeon]NIY03428.1 HD domain-containing protein [Thermoplasmata archaeon]